MGSPAAVPDIISTVGDGDKTKRQAATSMEELTQKSFTDFINTIEAVMFDCDGIYKIGFMR